MRWALIVLAVINIAIFFFCPALAKGAFSLGHTRAWRIVQKAKEVGVITINEPATFTDDEGRAVVGYDLTNAIVNGSTSTLVSSYRSLTFLFLFQGLALLVLDVFVEPRTRPRSDMTATAAT